MDSNQTCTLHTGQVRGRYGDGATCQGVEVAYLDEHLDAFDAWLAGVKRDAAREALDGYIRWEVDGDVADDIEAWRDAHYPTPEETP